MKKIQEALAPTKLPVYASIWKPTAEHQRAPEQYLVYSTTTTEDEHYDDQPVSYMTYVYLNLWSTVDPTDAVRRVRKAMYTAGFAMLEESDKGYNRPAYNTDANLYMMGWTWVLRTNVVSESKVNDEL